MIRVALLLSLLVLGACTNVYTTAPVGSAQQWVQPHELFGVWRFDLGLNEQGYILIGLDETQDERLKIVVVTLDGPELADPTVQTATLIETGQDTYWLSLLDEAEPASFELLKMTVLADSLVFSVPTADSVAKVAMEAGLHAETVKSSSWLSTDRQTVTLSGSSEVLALFVRTYQHRIEMEHDIEESFRLHRVERLLPQ